MKSNYDRAQIHIYTDGGCRGNGLPHNIGAWAFIIQDLNTGKEIRRHSEVIHNTTNNKMELSAAIESLHYIYTNPTGYFHSDVTIYTDSMYLYNGINKWMGEWVQRDFKNVKNYLYWIMLTQQLKCIHDEMYTTVIFKHVRGHSENEGNNRVDEMVNVVMDTNA